RRHEILRTSFLVKDAEPTQVISSAAELRLPVIDLEKLNLHDRLTLADRILREEARRPFDLTRAPLMRVMLVRLQQDEHLLLLTMHHIVSDGWSMGVLIREINRLYTGYVQGERGVLEELPVQYSDYAQWQRQSLRGKDVERQMEHWRECLGGEAPMLELPTDFPRPPVPSFEGAVHHISFTESLSESIRSSSRREGVTPFMFLLACYNALLYRYSHQTRFNIGIPVANRNALEIEALIGFFVNTQVFAADLSDNPSFHELLIRTRRTALSNYSHDLIPFEKLVDELQPQRDLSRTPLFQAMFVFQNLPVASLSLPGVVSEVSIVHNGTAKFDLTLYIEEVNEHFTGTIEYNRDIFDSSRIERMSEHFIRVVESVIGDTESKVWEVGLLGEDEERLL